LAALQAAVKTVGCGGWIQAAGGVLSGPLSIPGTSCPAGNPVLLENQHMRDICVAGSPAPCNTDAFPVGTPLFPPAAPPAQALAGTTWVPTLSGLTNAAVLTISDNASGWFIAGFEVTLAPTAASNKYRPIVGMGENTVAVAALPHDIWFWQMLIHPAPCLADSLTAPCNYAGRGIDLNVVRGGLYYSRVWGIVAPGQDTQAVNINNSPGPVDTIGNFLQSTGENLMMNTECTVIGPGLSNPPPGTTQGSTGWLPGDIGIPTCPVPTNITVRQNHFHKDLAWRTLPAGCDASKSQCYDVKNQIECKNCSTVLVDGNFFDTTFPGGQSGFYIMNCWAQGQYVCEDVTFTNNVFAHGVAIGSSLVAVGSVSGNGAPVTCLTCGYTGPPIVRAGVRVLFRNILAVDISGNFAQLQNTDGVTFDHITSVNGSGMTSILNALNFSDKPPSTDAHFQATNSMLFGIPFANSQPPGSAIAGLPAPIFGGLYFLGDYWSYPDIFGKVYTPIYPPGVQSLSSSAVSLQKTPPVTCQNNNSVTQQCWPLAWALAGMVDFAGCSAGTNLAGCALAPASPLKGKGTDGADIGPNIPAVLAATALARQI